MFIIMFFGISSSVRRMVTRTPLAVLHRRIKRARAWEFMDDAGIDVAIKSISTPRVHVGDDARVRSLGRLRKGSARITLLPSGPPIGFEFRVGGC